MSNKNIIIKFWEDEGGFKPVEDFFNKLNKICLSKILKRIEFVNRFSFDELLKYDDTLTLPVGCSKIKPRPYELKIKISPPIRIACYREDKNTLVLVEAVNDSFSNKKKFKRALEIYKTRVC